MVAVGFWPRARREPLIPFAPLSWLVVAIVVLAGFRVAANVIDSEVIDVGYASVIGADRIAHGEELYEGFPRMAREVDGELDLSKHPGDVYGPVNYLAYVPFEQAFPSSGSWDDVPAAHAAAITFDLLTALGLFLLGSRFRTGREGRVLGVALTFAWLAYPYTLFALHLNTNDALVAMLLTYALLALSSAPARGALVALGAAAKAAPLAVAPLFARGAGEASLRQLVLFTAAFLAVAVVAILPFLPPGGFDQLYDHTLGYQADREPSEVTLWAQAPSLDWLRDALRGTAVVLALLVAFVPRRRDPIQVAALGSAVLIAFQLGLNHWFYPYVLWFAPLVLFAAFASYRPPGFGGRG